MNKWVPAFFNAGKVTDSLWRRCGDPPTARLHGVSLAQSLERERDGHSVHVYAQIEYFTLLLITPIAAPYCNVKEEKKG